MLLGLSAAIGYGLGVLGAWVWREFASRGKRHTRAGQWRGFTIEAMMGGLLAMVVGSIWQGQVRVLVGVDQVSVFWVVLVPVVARALRAAYRWIAKRLEHRRSPRAARAVGLVVIVVATALVVNGALLNWAMAAADRAFAVQDLTTPGVSTSRPRRCAREGRARLGRHRRGAGPPRRARPVRCGVRAVAEPA